MNNVIDATYLMSGIYAIFRSLLCKNCDVGYYAHNTWHHRLRIQFLDV